MLFTAIDGRRLEYRMVPGEASRPVLVFLHEGLGCAALWRDFPDKVAKQVGSGALVYSRFGYGQSDGLSSRRTPRFMHEEALDVLPRLLEQLHIVRPLLIGHSDGASIALIHAAAQRPVAGLVLMAPHVFVESISLASIAQISESYAQGDLRKRLANYHAHVDDAFHGWAATWLSPAFQTWSLVAEVHALTQPALLIQGEDDEYGTLAQIDAIGAAAKGPVTRLVLAKCGHAPHRDQEAIVVQAIEDFARGLAP